MRNSCPIGYIYALFYDGKPIYIGQSKVSASDRYRQHKYNYEHFNTKLYLFLRGKSQGSFYDNVKLKVLKCCAKHELDYWENRYIKYCKSKGIELQNIIKYR